MIWNESALKVAKRKALFSPGGNFSLLAVAVLSKAPIGVAFARAGGNPQGKREKWTQTDVKNSGS